MTKIYTFFCLIGMSLCVNAQTRISLYEEFTGENCGPCAATNPGLNTLLSQASNTALVIPIKWQVAIPSAPNTSWSLYQTDAAEINWRAYSYGYGINSAPSGRMDGLDPTTFGAASDHPADLNSTVISSAASYTTPFAITMDAVWDATYTTAVVSITVQSSQTFTSTGALNFRLVLIERAIHFSSAPGTNGEKDFEDVVRKSYPTIQAGTSLPTSWTIGQSQTFTVTCNAPGYIVDKSQMAFVGFIQDDGTKKVWQTARTSPLSLSNDAKLNTVSLPTYTCSSSINPSVNIINQGNNAITDMTVVPTIDGVPQTAFIWNGSLASSANTNIALGTYTAAAGNHTIDFNISGVSGGDINTNNNSQSTNAALIQTYFATPLAEAFPSNPFPPLNWFVINVDKGPSWSRHSGAGYNGPGAAKYDFFNNSTSGDADDLFLPPSDLTGLVNPMLSFDVAYAQYSTENDRLEVKVSTNCGATWTSIFNKSGSVLKTSNPQTSGFTPSTNNQWRNEIVQMPAAAINNPSVLIRFIATSNYGNNLYIDNVNIADNITSVQTHNSESLSVQLYPNPSADHSNLDITTKAASQANIIVYNAIGQKVIEKNIRLNQGYNNFILDTKVLVNGLYNVILISENTSVVKKLTVAK